MSEQNEQPASADEAGSAGRSSSTRRARSAGRDESAGQAQSARQAQSAGQEPQRGTINTSAVATCVAALSVALTASSFSGVLADFRWVPKALLVVVAVAATGLLARRLRWWRSLTVVAQLAVLCVLLTASFTTSGLLRVLPTPSSFGELGDVLSAGLALVREGVPPVPADTGLSCLVCLGLGLVAVLVDLVAASLGAPAVAGLVLLCVFAVPASLAGAMLPWWSFVAGAGGFALLLSTGGAPRRWRLREDRTTVARTMLGSPVVVITSTATVLALITGIAVTGVGTQGRLPGSGTAGYGSATGKTGLRPFTSLRGQLDRDRSTELFRVRGLPERTYLRAMTLRKFDPARGWQLDGLTQGVPADQQLPPPEGTRLRDGTPADVRIDPVGYRDPWLPIFGQPTSVSGMGPGWRYDPASGVVFTQSRQESRPYSEQFVVPHPTPEQLRAARGPVAVDPAYLDTAGVSPEIHELADRVTAQAPTPFDKAVALNRFFTDPTNGFRYDLNTAPPAGSSALSDFLFGGKQGFCEQFASAMAVLLRSEGIPARVAVGFTPGYQDGDSRVITTNDAHAWVEAYFPGWGWTTFDPTPLPDGRRAAPEYLDPPQPPPPGQEQPGAPDQGDPPQPDQGDGDSSPAPAPPPTGDESAWTGPLWSVLGGFALVLVVLAGPLGVRELRRRRRLRAVAAAPSAAAPSAAGPAWSELLDQLRDRGDGPAPAATVREIGADLVDRHGLDEDGARAVRELVHAVEAEWYGPPGRPGEPGLDRTLHEISGSFRRNAPLSWRERLLPRSVVRLGGTGSKTRESPKSRDSSKTQGSSKTQDSPKARDRPEGAERANSES